MKDHTNTNLYQAITTIWHCRYLQKYKDERNYPYFQNIVRLLKDWKKEQDVPFLKSIHLELITADTYDCNYEDFKNINDNDIPFILDRCFENILDTLNGYPVIPYRWKYCNDEGFSGHYNFPVLIDPANPADNLLAILEKLMSEKSEARLISPERTLTKVIMQTYSTGKDKQHSLVSFNDNTI
jgi:hypothetical protein